MIKGSTTWYNALTNQLGGNCALNPQAGMPSGLMHFCGQAGIQPGQT